MHLTEYLCCLCIGLEGGRREGEGGKRMRTEEDRGGKKRKRNEGKGGEKGEEERR